MMARVTGAEIIAVAEGSADGLTERRVLAAALHDAGLRRQLMLLRSVEAETDPLPELSSAERDRLQQSLATAARRMGREYAERQAAPSTPPPAWLAQVQGTVRRVLAFEKHRFGLAALAPALAASAESLRVQRESVEAQGVRLEIHQLPDNPPRLRFYVDASAAPEFLAEEVSTVALALQEEGNPQLQILSVPLNAEGRGVLELPAPTARGTITLLGVALVTP